MVTRGSWQGSLEANIEQAASHSNVSTGAIPDGAAQPLATWTLRCHLAASGLGSTFIP